MPFLLLLLLFISPQSFAQKNLGRESFMVNVRPVLNGILNDFYQMVTLFPDFPKELIPLVLEIDSLTSDKEILRESCPRILNQKCLDTVKSIRLKLQKIRSLSMDVLTQQQMSTSLHLNSISGLRIISQFDSELEEVKGFLDNASFLTSAQIPHKRETYQMLKELDELNTILSLAIVEYIPYQYKDDFRHFYFNFIHPIQEQISKNSNYIFFKRNIDSLNFTLHLFNQNLTKRSKKTPEGMGPYLSLIHNRWNSIQRLYF